MNRASETYGTLVRYKLEMGMFSNWSDRRGEKTNEQENF